MSGDPRRSSHRGQSLTEFAMVLPVLLLLLLGTIDFGGFFGTRLSVQNAVRVGAAYAVVNPTSWTGSSSIAAATEQASDFGTLVDGNITIGYYLLTVSLTSACGQWTSAAGMVYYTVSGTTYTKATCLVPNNTLIKVTAKYTYLPLTPIPKVSVITTTAVATLLEEQ
ncbi:MAG: pilus assembly protein [Candidatus Dormibacteraeota bacterium]|nr:pilus assembly protein [Candidatus Dormibacteraeota bacterium]